MFQGPDARQLSTGGMLANFGTPSCMSGINTYTHHQLQVERWFTVNAFSCGPRSDLVCIGAYVRRVRDVRARGRCRSAIRGAWAAVARPPVRAVLRTHTCSRMIYEPVWPRRRTTAAAVVVVSVLVATVAAATPGVLTCRRNEPTGEFHFENINKLEKLVVWNKSRYNEMWSSV